MTNNTATKPGVVEIVPAGSVATAERGRRASTGFTAHYDVICSRCGIAARSVMYPTATREKADHLCVPARRR